MMSVLLDTCVFVDLLRGRQTAIDATAAFPVRPCVCDVTMMELYVGARTQREQARIEMVLSDFAPVSIEQSIYRRAGQWMRHYKASHGLDVPDALIAATAEHHGLALVTLNVKHFPMFPKLRPAY
jgi:predicted nucleic acid-binding protein